MTGQMDKRHSQPKVRGQWMLLALILLAFVLRMYALGGPEFWFDEALSANISGLGWAGAIAYLRNAPFEHPPLYFLSLYLWQRLAGTSEFAFRLFSVFWGILFIPLFYAFVKRLADERVGRLAALLATISPFLVAYSREARMYTVLPCLALLAVLSFQRALEREGKPGWWLAYALLLTVGVATQYFFAGIWAAITVYLILEWPRRRRVATQGLVVQAFFLVVAMIWWFATPGLRASVARVFQGEAAVSLGYKLNKIIPILLLDEAGGTATPAIAYVLMAGGWVLILLGVWWSRRAQILDPRAWRLLLVLVVVPLLGSLLIPYGVLGRHLGYTLIAILPFTTFALLALRHRGWFWLAVGILLILLSTTYSLVVQYRQGNGDFGQALAYIDERGQPGDLLIITQPSQRYLAEYYNKESWPIRYLPDSGITLTATEVDNVLGSIAEEHARLWLGPIGAWTVDPEHLVERWLAANTFQAEKVWFPASSTVALYFTDDESLIDIETEPVTFGDRIRLQRFQASPLQVSPGDALRLRFDWRAGLALGKRYAVSLLLVDGQGLVWAERSSEPCSGWCPTDAWTAKQRLRDLHALLIPPGTPPGAYHLQVSWAPVGGGPALPVEGGDEQANYVTLAEVTVLPSSPTAREPESLPNRLKATFGGQLTLLGYELTPVEVRPGETLHLEIHWRAETAPADDYKLAVELTDREGQTVTSWQVAPATSFYPTSAWQSGAYVRGQHNLTLSQYVWPGRYQVRLALLSPTGQRLALSGERPRQALARLIPWPERLEGHELTLTNVSLSDRSRQFELPPVPYPLDATVGKRAHLVGYDLDVSQAYPGGQLPLTLFWQASGPMVRPFKVFTHLVNAQGTVLAQHDAPPGGSCCPTHTWADGEVIVDEHLIPLDVNLPPGTYELVVGMYDEQAASRLPAYAASGEPLPGDSVTIRSVTIEPAQGPESQATAAAMPQFDTSYILFLPLVCKGSPQ
jgi:4-amino-4-deoxy-L-arabinose transferase-like glycosyltransferase